MEIRIKEGSWIARMAARKLKSKNHNRVLNLFWFVNHDFVLGGYML